MQISSGIVSLQSEYGAEAIIKLQCNPDFSVVFKLIIPCLGAKKNFSAMRSFFITVR